MKGQDWFAVMDSAAINKDQKGEKSLFAKNYAGADNSK